MPSLPLSPTRSRSAPATVVVKRFAAAPKARSSLSTSRGRQVQAGVPSKCKTTNASSYRGIGGGGMGVLGSSSVSQLLDVKKMNSRSRSTLTGDQTLPQPVSVLSKSQPSLVAKKSSGRPRSAAAW